MAGLVLRVSLQLAITDHLCLAGLTPRNVVRDHLGFSEETLDRLPQIKPYILPGNPDLLTTDFRAEIE